jgi:hypothetical protein
LAPGWSAAVRDFGWEIQHDNRVVHVALHGPDGLRRFITSRPWHPSFALELGTQRLAWEWEGPLPFEVRTVVEPGR